MVAEMRPAAIVYALLTPPGLSNEYMNDFNSIEIVFDKELDARGQVCPLPILRTKQALANMSSGQVLKIVSTDPAAAIDFQVFAEQTGHTLLSMSENDQELVFFLRKR